jgi:hypothetical protein
MARQINPRRQLVRGLRDIKRVVGLLVTHWEPRGTVYLAPDEREIGGSWKRPRRPDEYPENSAVDWDTLADRLDEIRLWCAATAETARSNAAYLARQASDAARARREGTGGRDGG